MNNKAQSLAEYIIIATIMAVVLVGMSVPFRGSVQRVVKDVVDLIGLQSDAEQARTPEQGHLMESVTDSQTIAQDTRQEGENLYQTTSFRQTNSQMSTDTFLGTTF